MFRSTSDDQDVVVRAGTLQKTDIETILDDLVRLRLIGALRDVLGDD